MSLVQKCNLQQGGEAILLTFTYITVYCYVEH